MFAMQENQTMCVCCMSLMSYDCFVLPKLDLVQTK